MICFAFLPGRVSGRAENTLTCKCDYRNYRSYVGSHDPSASKIRLTECWPKTKCVASHRGKRKSATTTVTHLASFDRVQKHALVIHGIPFYAPSFPYFKVIEVTPAVMRRPTFGKWAQFHLGSGST